MNIELPLFRDGEKLSERDLFDLAWYAVCCARWTGIGSHGGGFIAPPATERRDTTWNGIDVKNGVIHPLFLIHDGFPLIVPMSTPMGSSGRRLFAKLRIARSSAGPVVGYQVDFAWDDDSNPDNRYVTIAAIAERGEKSAAQPFELVPRAATLDAVPELAMAHADLARAARAFRGLLAGYAARAAADCDLLMDRLERLATPVDGSPTEPIFGEIRLSIRAARGFFYRARYRERPDLWPSGPSRPTAPTSAVLEHELEGGRPDPVAVGLPDILRDPGSAERAADQVRIVRRLTDDLREGGALWRLLADNSIPPGAVFPDMAGHLIRRYDCLNTARVTVELTGDRGGSPRAASSGDPERVPAGLRALPRPEPRPDGRRISRLDCAERYLFVAAPRNTVVTVSPEDP